MKFGNQTAVVSTLGASLRRYFVSNQGADGHVSDTDLIWGYQGFANKQGGQGDVLIPFPSRIKNGEYVFDGHTYQLEKNDKEGPNAIHGFLRTRHWDYAQTSAARITFAFQMREEDFADNGYPFSLTVHVTYELSAQGLVTEFEIKNTGTRPAPVGVGFHGYFLAGDAILDESETLLPADRFMEFEALIPTGRLLPIEGSEWDFTKMKRIGDVRFNHCLTDLRRDDDGLARAYLRNPRTGQKLCVWMDRSFNYLVVYTGDAIAAPYRRKAFAIEPLTCGTNAFNRHEWGLKKLAPNEIFKGRYGINPFG